MTARFNVGDSSVLKFPAGIETLFGPEVNMMQGSHKVVHSGRKQSRRIKGRHLLVGSIRR